MRAAVLASAVGALAGCHHARPAAPAEPPVVIAVFPVQNATGGAAPIRALAEALEAAVGQRAIQVVSRRALEEVLAAHRIRFNAGLDGAAAKILREELGVDAVLVPTLEQYDPGPPPRISLAIRAVGTSDRPPVLWAGSVARSGDDAPGLLGLGRVSTVAELERRVIAAAADAVARWAGARERADLCEADRRFRPRRSFRAPVLDDVGRRVVAVLPFANETRRRDAGQVVAGQFVSQLALAGTFDVLDPGVVREELLTHRIVLEGGVSVDQAMVLLELLDADLLVAGTVRGFSTPTGAGAVPSFEFAAYVLDRGTGELVWSSSSQATGDDGVFFFGAGRLASGGALACRMVRGVVDGISGVRGLDVAATPAPLDRPQGLRARGAGAQLQRRAREPIARDFYENGRAGRARAMNQRRAGLDETAPSEDSLP